jgi:hypothetical protein
MERKGREGNGAATSSAATNYVIWGVTADMEALYLFTSASRTRL